MLNRIQSKPLLVLLASTAFATTSAGAVFAASSPELTPPPAETDVDVDVETEGEAEIRNDRIVTEPNTDVRGAVEMNEDWDEDEDNLQAPSYDLQTDIQTEIDTTTDDLNDTTDDLGEVETETDVDVTTDIETEPTEVDPN